MQHCMCVHVCMQVWGTWAPEGMSLPYTDAHVIMAPMKLRLEASPVVSQLMESECTLP